MNRALFFKLSLLFFFQFFIWGSWYVTTGTYLLQTVQFSGREVGLVYTCTALAATISPLLLGALADRLFSVEKLLAVLHASGGMLMFGISFLKTFAFFYPALILYALLYMPTFALASALSFHHLENGARDFPRVRVWGSVGWISTGLLISFFDLETTAVPMRLSALASLGAAVFCLFLPPTPPQSRIRRRGLRDFFGPEIMELLRRRSFAVLIVCLLLISIPSGFYYSFTNSFLTEIGVENPAAKMTAGQFSELILMLLMPFLFLRLGFRWIFTIGLLAWGSRYALFAWGDADSSAWMLWLGILLHGVAFNFTSLTGQIYIDRIAPTHIRSTAQGFMSMATLGFGALIGSFLAGEVVDRLTLPDGSHQWPLIWTVPSILGLLTTLAFLLFFREKSANT